MVIGKDKKRIKELEEQVKDLTQRLVVAIERIDSVETKTNSFQSEIKDLSMAVENAVDSGSVRKTPQQLIQEWFTGEEK